MQILSFGSKTIAAAATLISTLYQYVPRATDSLEAVVVSIGRVCGGSAGGMLVGACMTQRPELFAVALPAVGVLDMLRYHLFTIGWAWASDYGTVDDPAQFATEQDIFRFVHAEYLEPEERCA